VNAELGMMQNKAVIAQFQVLSQYLPGRADEIEEEPHSR
jgi:hypothetical protein